MLIVETRLRNETACLESLPVENSRSRTVVVLRTEHLSIYASQSASLSEPGAPTPANCFSDDKELMVFKDLLELTLRTNCQHPCIACSLLSSGARLWGFRVTVFSNPSESSSSSSHHRRPSRTVSSSAFVTAIVVIIIVSDDINTMPFTILLSAQIAEW